MAAPATVQQIINYYVNLLIIQYHNLPNAQGMIQTFISSMIQNGIALDVQDAYDVNTAVGVQLDVLGKYENINRFYQGQIFDNYFALLPYSAGSVPSGALGFSKYTNFIPPAGAWLDYADILSTTLALSDDDFRILLKLRIIQNNMNFSRGAIDNAMFQTFGLNLIPDSIGNMIMDYFTTEENAAIFQVALQQGVLPKPMGVWLRYLISQHAPFFGFATYAGYSPLITGFSNYTNYGTESGETLDYADLITG